MYEVLVNRLGGPSLSRKSVVRNRPDMTTDVYRGRKTSRQQYLLRNTGLSPFFSPSFTKGTLKE